MYISQFETTIEQIKPFLKDYLEEKGFDTSKNFKCIFPGHNDTNPSCNLIKGGDRIWCFSCGRSGDLFDVVQILENKPSAGVDWLENTLRYLADKYNVKIDLSNLTEEQVYELDTYHAYKAASEIIKSTKLDPQKHKRVIEELERRQWTIEAINEMGIGTVSSYNDFREALKAQEFTPAFLDAIDLSRKDIFSEDNIIFTWYDEKGRPVGFTCRNLLYEKGNLEDSKSKKYINLRTGLKCNIFQKGRRFYGIERAVKNSPPLYIFEGQSDVVTARLHGLNCSVAIAGTSLCNDHIQLLKTLGIYHVIIALDGDAAGRDRLKQILEDRFGGHKELRVQVMILPEEYDPDSFLREKGIEDFEAINKLSAFEWKLLQFNENDDPSEIIKQTMPFIVNEPSAVVREDYCRQLCSWTGYPYNVINADLTSLLDIKHFEQSKERRNVLESLTYNLNKFPSEAEAYLLSTLTGLRELNKKHNKDALSEEEFHRYIISQKVKEESKSGEHEGFKLGEDLKGLEQTLCGDWTKDVFLAIGGRENTGKTAALCKLAYSIATNNPNVCVLYHTIDDTAEQILPRFVCIAEGSTQLTMNMVRNPKYWKSLGHNDINKRRSAGYKEVQKLAKNGSLIIKDVNYGSSLMFAESLVEYYKTKFPERKVVYILDNFHKLMDFTGIDNERVRFKKLSQSIKEMGERYHVPVITSVEYTKLPLGHKPSNHNISETVQISYDCNWIAHVYNEMADYPDKIDMAHKWTNYNNKEVFLPRLEILVGKNKISGWKGTFYIDFYPESSDFRAVDLETVIRERNDKKQEVRKDDGELFTTIPKTKKKED